MPIDMNKNKTIIAKTGLLSFSLLELGVPMDVIMCGLSLMSIYMRLEEMNKPKQTTDRQAEYSKDINVIRELYKAFLDNYNTLNKIFDLSNPVQIYAMYIYLLGKGYLSKDKKFTKNDENSLDINSLLSADIFMGAGVCRHISFLLTDILNTSGIKTENLNVYMDVNRKSDTHFIELLYGNHVITFASFEGKSYFLDATNSLIYRMGKNGILHNKKGPNIKFKETGTDLVSFASKTISIDKSGYDLLLEFLRYYIYIRKDINMELEKQFKYPSISREEEKDMITSTHKICEGNLDIFENFYRDNRPLYEDICEKTLTFSKTRC